MSAHADTDNVEIEIVPEQEVPDILPVMPLKNFVLFPQMVAPLVITSDESKKLVTELSTRTPHFITALQRKDEIDETNLTQDDKPYGKSDENAVSLALNVIYKF